jgi:hypothetical protein
MAHYDDYEAVVSRRWRNGKVFLRLVSLILCGGIIGLTVPMAVKYKEEAKRLDINYDMVVDVAIEAAPPVSIPASPILMESRLGNIPTNMSCHL